MLTRIHKLTKDERGLAAVEFAFIAPVMILLFFATVELASAIDCRTRVAVAASTGADLVAQETIVSSSDTTNVFAALGAILYPYSASNAQIVISSIVDNGHGGGTVAWSDASNTTARTVGATVSLPSGLITSGSGDGVILAEITYSYTSPTLTVLTGTVSMTNSFYARPRRTTTVSHS